MSDVINKELMNIFVGSENGKVFIKFEKPIYWIDLTIEQAREVILGLQISIKQLENKS